MFSWYKYLIASFFSCLGFWSGNLYPDRCLLVPFHVRFGFDWSTVSEENRFKYYGNIHIYCPGKGVDDPLRSLLFSESLIFSPTTHFMQDFSFK